MEALVKVARRLWFVAVADILQVWLDVVDAIIRVLILGHCVVREENKIKFSYLEISAFRVLLTPLNGPEQCSHELQQYDTNLCPDLETFSRQPKNNVAGDEFWNIALNADECKKVLARALGNNVCGDCATFLPQVLRIIITNLCIEACYESCHS